MLKSFEELSKIDVTPWCKNRDGFLYLNWAKCIDLLHQNGAETVYFEPVQNEKTGGSLFYTDMSFSDSKGNTNRCYETKIRVVIDDKEYFMQSPVMNGQNPVKDNSMNQLRVWNSMCRSFVKCVAIHTGLGFNLWLREENKPFSDVVGGEVKLASKSQIKILKELCKNHHVDGDYWVNSNGKTWEELTADEAGMMLNALKEKYGDE